MMFHFRRLIESVGILFLIGILLTPTVYAEFSNRKKVIVIGTENPPLGYDEIVNGTTTFIVAREPNIVNKTGYHNITKFMWRSTRVEASPEILGAYYDKSTRKYYFDNVTLQSYDVTVPDPSGTVTVFSNMVFKGTCWNPKSKAVIHCARF